MSTWTQVDGVAWEMRDDGQKRPVGPQHPRLLAYLDEQKLTIDQLPVMPLEVRPFKTAPPVVPSVKRAQYYAGQPMIDLGGSEKATCDSVLLTIQAYQLEGNEAEADRLKGLWSEARAKIRTDFPDKP
jgi:hypothetical protein